MTKFFDKGALIPLQPEGLTRSTTLREAYMVILKEEREGGRHLPLLIDRAGYELLERVFATQDDAPLSLALDVATLYDITLTEVVVGLQENGHIGAEMHFRQPQSQGWETVERTLFVPLATGIAAAVEDGCRVSIHAMDFELLYARSPKEGQVAIPIATMTDDLLSEALREAVENEWFELASQLRDELKNRHASDGQPSAAG